MRRMKLPGTAVKGAIRFAAADPPTVTRKRSSRGLSEFEQGQI